MQNAFRILMRVMLAGALALALAPAASIRKGKHTDITEILSNMNAKSKEIHTVIATLDYTSVTVLVNDKSTQSGKFYFQKSKPPKIGIHFEKPEKKVILFKNNKGYMFLPTSNQIQEYDLTQKASLVQQFLLLGFGTDTAELKKTYTITYVKEEDVMPGDTNVELELTPHKENVAPQITSIHLWVSEESWLPSQQEFIQSSGDSLIARYTGVKVNREDLLPRSAFELDAPKDATCVKMNSSDDKACR